MKQEKFYNDLSETLERIYDCDYENICLKFITYNHYDRHLIIKTIEVSPSGRSYYEGGWKGLLNNKDSKSVKTLVALQVNFGDT